MLVLPETVTVREAREVLQMFEASIAREAADPLTVDASALRDFDSAALALLLECARQAKAYRRGFAVRGAPPKLTELAVLYGVDELLDIARPAAA
jgi:phospholipid transport system transporter-binding protein